MVDPNVVVQTLRELGITRTEAEVYVATLLEAGGRPVSGYRVAQSAGKDPANLSKTLASLEKLGAVRTVQEKPRLYIPIPPQEFTDKLMADMRSNQSRVLDQLSDLSNQSPMGVPMALNDRLQTIQKTSQLISNCRRELLIFAAREVLEELGTALEALAASSEINVKVLGLEILGWDGITEKTIDLPVGFTDPKPIPWLHVVIDRQTWLTASFSSVDGDKQPCGWWSEDPSMALILGAGLDAAMQESVKVSIEIPPVETLEKEPDPELQTKVSEDDSEAPQWQAHPVVEVKPVEETTPEPSEGDMDDDDDQGLQFIIRHDNDDDGPSSK